MNVENFGKESVKISMGNRAAHICATIWGLSSDLQVANRVERQADNPVAQMVRITRHIAGRTISTGVVHGRSASYPR